MHTLNLVQFCFIKAQCDFRGINIHIITLLLQIPENKKGSTVVFFKIKDLKNKMQCPKLP